MSPAVQKGAPVQMQTAAPALTTPQVLKLGLAGVWITTLLLMTAGIVGARSHRHAMQVVGKDAAPSIIAAQRIASALADMDANAAAESRGIFNKRRDEAVWGIVAAAENITYGDDERKPIHDLAAGLGTYAAQVQAARDRHEVAAWREAASIMDNTLLPAAAKLDEANRKELDKAYAAQDRSSSGVMAMLMLAGLLAGVVLISVQFFTASRMRRMLNPLLFLATLATLIFVIYAGQRFRSSAYQLKVAKEEAFESIHLLWQARAAAYSANGDLARAALDPAQKATYEKAFKDKAEKVSKSYLADELRNITFDGEEEAAKETAKDFNEYQSARTATAFKAFDGALDKTLKVNKDAFDAAVAQGFADVDNFEIAAPIWALAISLLAWVGLRPRMREYSA